MERAFRKVAPIYMERGGKELVCPDPSRLTVDTFETAT